MTFLPDILGSKRKQIDALGSLSQLQQKANEAARGDLRSPIWSSSLDVIAEIKRKSPSKGELSDISKPDQLAKSYESGGAAMVSVLTDEKYFGAQSDDLKRVRNEILLPVLRKDFVIDIRQVYETYLMGADVMLLIVAAFSDVSQLSELYESAKSLGLKVVVETHSMAEIEVAHELGAEMIGVNVRDLATFEEKPELGDLMIKEISDGTISIWESSIRSLDDAKRAKDAGADAVLVGQGLVQHKNPTEFIQQIKAI